MKHLHFNCTLLCWCLEDFGKLFESFRSSIVLVPKEVPQKLFESFLFFWRREDFGKLFKSFAVLFVHFRSTLKDFVYSETYTAILRQILWWVFNSSMVLTKGQKLHL